MGALIRLIVVIVVIGGLGLYAFAWRNNTSFKPETIDLAVDCSDLTNILVTSAVNVTVKNMSFRSHNNISVQVKAFDGNGNLLKEKYTTFSRTMLPSSLFDKPVTLPAGTKHCECKVVSSSPQ